MVAVVRLCRDGTHSGALWGFSATPLVVEELPERSCDDVWLLPTADLTSAVLGDLTSSLADLPAAWELRRFEVAW